MSVEPNKPTALEIRSVARRTTTLLRGRGISCCLFGGAGCALYGLTRVPNDIDLVIFTSEYTQEEVKALLVSMDRNFYTRNPRKEGATYKVLWYRIPGSSVRDPRTRRSYLKTCKVDVLVPPSLNIPVLSPTQIREIDGLPVMELVPLLLLKVQGWDDHRAAPESHLRQKQYTDISDVREMLRIAVRSRVALGDAEQVSGLPDDFVEAGRKRLEAFKAVVSAVVAESINQILSKPLIES